MFLLDFLGLPYIVIVLVFLDRPVCPLSSFAVIQSPKLLLLRHPPPQTHTTFKFKPRMFNLQTIFQNHFHFSIIIFTALIKFPSLLAALSCKTDLSDFSKTSV